MLLNFFKNLFKSNAQGAETMKKEFFRFFVALLLAVLAFILTNIWMESMVDKNELVEAVVASRDLKAPKVLSREDLTTTVFLKTSLPLQAITKNELEKLVGVGLLKPLSKNQMITSEDVVKGMDPDLAGINIPKNAKGFKLPASWLSAPLPKLKKGDTVSIAFGFNNSEKNVSGILAQGVPVLGSELGDSGQSTSVIVVVNEKLFLDLVQLKASNYVLALSVDGLAPENPIFNLK